MSIVVPSAGPVAVLAATLAALRRELPDAPLTVVDDRGGRPEVAAAVGEFDAELLATDGAGPAGARNLGAGRSDTDWVLFCDDDITVQPGVGAALDGIAGSAALTVVGALYAPEGAPRWLADSYVNGSMAATAARRRSVSGDGTRMSCALALVRRSAWVQAGGFPPIAPWGWEEALFGLRVQRIADRPDWLVHDPRLRGVHHFLPSWEQWLARQRTAGERLHGLLADLSPREREQLLRAVVLADGPRAAAKRALGRLPGFAWRVARGSTWRRAAAAASFAAGYRAAAHAG